ncbi:MAG: PD-(D/E)XK nuclease family protein [Bacteroidaceae bacterium]|nr:PD-(D/E)XK nuclease family protein [Bacteroidaceae bacterium]
MKNTKNNTDTAGGAAKRPGFSVPQTFVAVAFFSAVMLLLNGESLMKSVLHSIPADEPQSPTLLNVTMGFPLVDTPVYSYFMALLDLQCDGYDADARSFRATFLSRLRSHVFCPESFKADNSSALSYAADDKALFLWLRECMETLGQSIKDMGLTEVYSQLYTEATFQVYCAVNQFCELLECGTLQVERSTLRRLVRQALSGGSIPFHGDMENGLQLMGLLETRNLDFSDVVVLSVEEGFLPKRSADVSLIPYCLKASYGLSTVERKTAVFAYYFFRLLQRAQHVTLVYNDNSDSLNQREPSCYLRQLLADTELPVECLRLESKVKTSAPASRKVPKTPEVLERMRQWFDLKKNGIYRLSPSALNSYLACPLQFYFQYVARLEPTAEVGEGVDNILFGTLVHDAAELVYKFLCNSLKTKTLEDSDIKEVLDYKDNPTIDAIIDLAFVVDYFLAAQYDSYKCREEREAFLRVFLEAAHPHELKQRVADFYRQTPSAAFVGTVLIIRSVVRRYLAAILRWDAAHAPITFCGFEYSISTRMSLETASGPVEIRTGGRIDRLDRLRINGTDYLRIVDYKTGKKKKEPKTLDDIFQPESEVDGAHYFLQTFLYGMILATDPQYAAYAHEKMRPCLFYIPQALHGEYSPDLAMDKVTVEQLDADTLADFRVRLEALIREIFDPQTPFRPCAEGKACKYCPFTTLCK